MKTSKPKIKYADLYGPKKEKYKFLENHNVKNTKWQNLEIKGPYYFFIPKDFGLEEKYNKFISIKDIFKNYNRGVVTSRDNFIIGSKEELKRNLQIFINKNFSDEMIKTTLKLKDTKGWKISEARQRLIDEGIKDDSFVNYCYRLFDNKKIYYENFLLERSRKEIMNNMLFNNLGLLLMRQVYWKNYNHIFISDKITDSRVFISNRGAADIFPLYLYRQQRTEPIFNGQRQLDLAGKQLKIDEQTKNKVSNIKKEILELLKMKYGKAIKPEEIFNYIYAVLYSNKYRQKFQEFLKIDFPRVPFTADYKLFKEFGRLGKELLDLHLLKSKKLNKTAAKFKGTGLNEVKKREYNNKEKRLYINDKQYFEGIEPEVWEYYIGGYQVLYKWVKDRIGRNLSRDEVEHYLKVATSLELTIGLQKEIDKLYSKVEKLLV